ncbi:MAG: rhomboid family intramembrane serine protease [Planctomycetes bacterium]|nr:rhomboid family intramembrane serine protease [Planctomycetota bacterium]
MVFPLFDDNSDRLRQPVVNYVLIIINVFVFVFLQELGREDNRFTMAFSTVPEEIVTGTDIEGPIDIPVGRDKAVTIQHEKTPVSVYLTLLTSMFMHGSIMHLLGNMLFLWIFGDNVEDYLGPLRYLAFYLVCGVLASMAHIATTYLFHQNPLIPSLGASGAISGVLGAYLILHPHRRVTVILFRFLTDVPAYVAIGLWFLFQLVNGLGMLGGDQGGVAYGAHIGGFLAGLALVKVFALNLTEPPPRQYPRQRYS